MRDDPRDGGGVSEEESDETTRAEGMGPESEEKRCTWTRDPE